MSHLNQSISGSDELEGILDDLFQFHILKYPVTGRRYTFSEFLMETKLLAASVNSLL
jgi:hypothetical protein